MRRRTRWSSYIPIMRQKEEALREFSWQKPVTLTFFFYSSQYDVSSPGDWSTAAVNRIWPGSALEMDSCPWTVRLHWATEEQGHSRPHQSRDLMLCIPSATKERRCDVCDVITDVFHKLSQRSWWGLCLNVWQIQHSWGVDDAKGVMQSTVLQPDIASSADWVWTKKTLFGRSSGQTFHYCGVMPAAD